MAFRTLLDHLNPRVAKEAKPVSKQKVPQRVSTDMLFETGKLLSDNGITILKRLNLPKGRHHRREIDELLKKRGIIATFRFPYSIIRGNGMHGEGDALYAVYRDQIQNQSVVIGSGGTSKVKEIQNLDTGTWCVLKVLSDFDEIASKEHAFLKTLGKADHLLIQKDSKKGTHKHEIIMERANGVELFKLMQSRQLPTDATLLKKIALNILIQLNDFHLKKIILRDLKLENIIVDPETGDATIIDLGFALNAKNGVGSDGLKYGTLQYMPPEILDNKYNTHFSFASDIYAAGLVLQELLTGQVLLYNKQDGYHFAYDGVKRIVKQGQLEIPYIVEPEIKKLYKSMLDKNPFARPGLLDACRVIKKYIPEDHQFRLFSRQPVIKNRAADGQLLDSEPSESNPVKPSVG